MKALSILTALLFYVTIASADVIIDYIDAEAHLKAQTGITPKSPGPYPCPIPCERQRIFGIKAGCKFQARRPPCIGKISITNIEVERVKRVKVEYPKGDIPVYRQNDTVRIKNCLPNEWGWNEKLTIRTEQRLESRNTTILTDVRNKSINISMDAGKANTLGLKFSGTFSRTTTVQTNNSEVQSQSETIELTKPLSMTVPPFTRRVINYSDGRTEAQIPVDIEVVLDGDVTENHVYESRGTIYKKNGRGRKGRLSKLFGADDGRTVTMKALIDVSGTDRVLDIALTEEQLLEDVAACQKQ